MTQKTTTTTTTTKTNKRPIKNVKCKHFLSNFWSLCIFFSILNSLAV